MSDVGANDHRMRPKTSFRHLGNGARSCASEFRVDLHEHIGNVLRVAFSDMARLQNLRRNTPTAVTGLLDSRVREGVLVGNDDHKKLGVLLELDAGRVVQTLDRFANVFLQFHDIRAFGDTATMTSVQLDERITEALNLSTINRAPLTNEVSNSPGIEGLSVGLVKLLSTKIPATVGAWVVALVTTKLDLGIRKQTGLGPDHVAVDLEAETLENRIIGVVKHLLGLVHRVKTVSWARGGIFDHMRSLVLIELPGVFVESMDSQDFHGIDDTLLGHLNHRKLPVVQSQVVLAPEVRLDVDRLLLASSFVDQVDGVLASVAVYQALDDEVGAQDGTATVVRLDLQLLEAAMDFVETIRLGLSTVAIIDGLQEMDQMLPVTSVENGHGSSHKGSTGPETGVRNIHVYDESAMLEHGVSTKYESEKPEDLQWQVEWLGKRP